KVGERAEFFGPAGKGSFVPRGKNSEPLFLLGTGTGIAPLLAVAEKLTREKSPRLITLFLGVSFEADIFYEKEFAELKKANPNFDFKIGVSRPSENYEGVRGRLPAILETTEIPKNVETLVCGSEASVAGIKNKLLELGVLENRIDAEGFGEVGRFQVAGFCSVAQLFTSLLCCFCRRFHDFFKFLFFKNLQRSFCCAAFGCHIFP
ncbi:FAD-dependent oxidoreductase, partial [Candidatus Gracilibacteria bacterium]|nr:FAD-dependent oxidoreductase [Candidatus Gracilibacteria bacterium]